MKRREFISLLGGAVAAWPIAARTQQAGRGVRIGILGPNLAKGGIAKAGLQILRERLHALGLSEGQDFRIEYKNIDDPRGLSVIVAELMQLRPDIIITSGPEIVLKTAIAAKGAVPIVMVAINFDPIARGYVTSLSRPGGDITGVVFQQLELAQKQVELLTQAFPDRNHLAVLFDGQSADQYAAAGRAAKLLKIQVQPVKLENPPYNFEVAFRSVPEGSGQMVLVLSSPYFIGQRSRIAALAIARRLPTMFIFKDYVEVGGLMSYGVDSRPMYRRVADDIAKILKGAKPADIPIEQPDKFDLVVNRKTAKAIGVELPAAILLRADEVIE